MPSPYNVNDICIFSLFSDHLMEMNFTELTFTIANEYATTSQLARSTEIPATLSAIDWRRPDSTLQKHAYPVIILLGLLGNLLVVLVYGKRHSNSPSSVTTCILSLAILDILFLLPLISDSMERLFNVSIRLSHTFNCRVVYYFAIVIPPIEAWILILMSAQKISFMLWPQPMIFWSSAKVTNRLVLLITTIVCVGYYHVCFYFKSWRKMCSIFNKKYYRLYVTTWYWVNLFLSIIIPTVILLLFGIVLFYKLFNPSAKQRNLSAPERVDCSTKTRKKSYVTVILIIKISLFLVFSLPFGVCSIIEFNLDHYGIDLVSDSRRNAHVILRIIYFCNVTVNFFIYSLTSSKFRYDLYQILLFCFFVNRCKKDDKRQIMFNEEGNATNQISDN